MTAKAELIDREVKVRAGSVYLGGTLTVPREAQGIVLFAHGSGSSRFSKRNRYVAQVLQQAGVATLLFDLLTAEEEAIDRFTAHLRFDIQLLVQRLLGATDWILKNPSSRELTVGYFGSSTGGAAALVAAAERPQLVRAVVSRGGRPDLAGDALARVQAPTLLIVGGNDTPVLTLHRMALVRMSAPVKLEIVPEATHLFEEPGALETVARLAADWFRQHLPAGEALVDSSASVTAHAS